MSAPALELLSHRRLWVFAPQHLLIAAAKAAAARDALRLVTCPTAEGPSRVCRGCACSSLEVLPIFLVF